MQDWLALDFGPNLGDNFRGFLFLKALKAAHPTARLTCWITPELAANLGGLLPSLSFVDRFLKHPRQPAESYRLIFQLLKQAAASGRPLALSHLPPGQGPDGRTYDKIIPTAEPWFLAKLRAGQPLEAPDPENQGETLCRLLELSPERAAACLPLFGRRAKAGDLICLGLNRPHKNDRKQLAPGRVARVWQAALSLGRPLAALDLQGWNPPPAQPNVRDLRQAPLADKIEVLNQAALFIGSDGGLNHFAAACGCPTLAFYGTDPFGKAGLLVGPYPRQTPFGRHRYCHDFDEFLSLAAAGVPPVA